MENVCDGMWSAWGAAGATPCAAVPAMRLIDTSCMAPLALPLAMSKQTYDKVDLRTRTLAYEAAMARLAERYPDDTEAAI
jgi:hypothetical protein